MPSTGRRYARRTMTYADAERERHERMARSWERLKAQVAAKHGAVER